ncbi:uncharacterized protein BKA78DRAFT_351637 [Phyllosticta capitalensis]|uniref:uncharacterized protein n=1 Tax=Phyllosticta capitalensis TaxID=121624 RepID=UPI003130B254
MNSNIHKYTYIDDLLVLAADWSITTESRLRYLVSASMELMRLGRTTHGSGRMHYDILQRLFAAYLSEGESQQWTERFKRFVLLNYLNVSAHRVAWRYLVKVPIILKTRELKGPGKDRKEEAAVFALKSAKFSRNNIVLTFPRTPMRPGNLNKRFSDWEDEDCVAAYMNFFDRAAFRSFLLSFPILNAYAVWRQHTDCLPRARQVLTLLVTNEYMFPLFLEEIVDELGRKEDSKTSKLKAKSKESPISREDLLLAAILIHLIEYTTPLLDRTSLHHKLEFQASANKTFNDLFGLEIPNSHNISEADVTYWGKRMHTVEHPIETYNRALVLLNHLHHLVIHEQWNTLWCSSDAFRPQKIPFEAYPAWMKKTDGDASHLLWN